MKDCKSCLFHDLWRDNMFYSLVNNMHNVSWFVLGYDNVLKVTGELWNQLLDAYIYFREPINTNVNRFLMSEKESLKSEVCSENQLALRMKEKSTSEYLRRPSQDIPDYEVCSLTS